MAGMLKKFVAGAAQTGADILKQERIASGEMERMKSMEELRGQIQGELAKRQQEFLAQQQQRTIESQEGIAAANREQAKALADESRKLERERLEQQGRFEQQRLKMQQAQLGAAGVAYAIGKDKAGNIRRGTWDPKTGRLMAGDVELTPITKEGPDIKSMLEVAKAYADAGDADRASAILDRVSLLFSGHEGADAQIRVPSAKEQPARKPASTSQPKKQGAAKPEIPDRITLIMLRNLAKAQPDTERGRKAAEALKRYEAMMQEDIDTSAPGFGHFGAP